MRLEFVAEAEEPQHQRHDAGDERQHSHCGAGVGAESGEHVSDPGHHQVDAEQDTRHRQRLARPGKHDDTERHGQDADEDEQLPGASSELLQGTFENGLFAVVIRKS